MKNDNLKNLVLVFLSLIFSIGLMFAFIELPVLLNNFIESNFGFPGFDQGSSEMNSYKSNIFIGEFYLRWIGYISLGVIIVLIIIGFTTKKSGWAFLGAFALFLPVFGQFALSMFFLAGLSILRVSWLPFMDMSFNALSLGNIIYLPYDLLMSFFRLFNWNAHMFLSYLFMGSGSFLFIWGVLVWMQTKFSSTVVASQKIYKFSRHPQYLGWILWSYGLVLYTNPLNLMKKTWSVSSSLPWLLSTMIIIGICLLEEIKMKKEGGNSYDKYRKTTPFLLPLPKWIKAIINFPARLVIKNEFAEKKSEVVKIISIYTIIFAAISFLRIDFQDNNPSRVQAQYLSPQAIDSLVNVIHSSTRRTFNKQFDELGMIGDKSIPVLIELLNDESNDIREFAALSLGRLKAKEAIAQLCNLTKTGTRRVVSSSIYALGQMATQDAEFHLISLANDSSYSRMNASIWDALSNYKSPEIEDILVKGLDDDSWIKRSAALRSIYNYNKEIAVKYIIQKLSDDHPRVKGDALNLILISKPIEAIPAIKQLLNDEDFEVRFYAKQVLKQMESQ